MKESFRNGFRKISAWISSAPRLLRVGAVFGVVLAVFILFLAWPYPRGYLASGGLEPVSVYDRHGKLLMEFTPGLSGFCRTVKREEIPETLERLLLFSEDRRFYRHHGVSFRDFARAMFRNVQSWRFRYGGSTLTQQLVKSLWGRSRNNLFTKPFEWLQALRLELHFSKSEILTAYVNRVYCGNRIYGFARASEIYFHKTLDQLDPAEAAALVSLVRAPSEYNPYLPEGLSRLKTSVRGLLSRAETMPQIAGLSLNPEEFEIYRNAELQVFPWEIEFAAPHFCLYALEEAKRAVPKRAEIRCVTTTLDLELYRLCLQTAKNRLDVLRDLGAEDASFVMIDNRTLDILVMIGSVDYFGDKGQINAARIKRQAASTMKAFTYALALEGRKFNPSSILPDMPGAYDAPVGKYVPKNYSERYHGPVRLAEALGSSLNVPAVYLLHEIGVYPLYRLLKGLGFDSINRQPSFYGLGLTLGNADVTLQELVNAYTVFPNNGRFSRARAVLKVEAADGRLYAPKLEPESRALTPETCLQMNRILSDYRYKEMGFGSTSALRYPFPVAAKTGTSKDYRDNWIVGYTPLFTSGLWVGNLHNQPMKQLPSSLGAAVLLRDVLLELYNSGYPFPDFQTGSDQILPIRVCSVSGKPAGPFCVETMEESYIRGTEPSSECDWHRPEGLVLPELYRAWAEKSPMAVRLSLSSESGLRIIHPADGDIFQLSPDIDVSHQKLSFEAVAPGEVEWSVDGKKVGAGKNALWVPEAGKHTVEARCRNGQSESVQIIVTE